MRKVRRIERKGKHVGRATVPRPATGHTPEIDATVAVIQALVPLLRQALQAHVSRGEVAA